MGKFRFTDVVCSCFAVHTNRPQLEVPRPLTRCGRWSESARVFAPGVCDGVDFLELNYEVKQNLANAAVIKEGAYKCKQCK